VADRRVGREELTQSAQSLCHDATLRLDARDDLGRRAVVHGGNRILDVPSLPPKGGLVRITSSRKRIQVSSGTYCRALAQLERRITITSQMLLTKADSDWVEAIDFDGFPAAWLLVSLLALGML